MGFDLVDLEGILTKDQLKQLKKKKVRSTGSKGKAKFIRVNPDEVYEEIVIMLNKVCDKFCDSIIHEECSDKCPIVKTVKDMDFAVKHCMLVSLLSCADRVRRGLLEVETAKKFAQDLIDKDEVLMGYKLKVCSR